jgi:hypothetical protein
VRAEGSRAASVLTAAAAAGLVADLLLVERHPLDDLRVLPDPLVVISSGRIGVERLEVSGGHR